MGNFKKSLIGAAVLSSLLVSGVSFADPDWNNGPQDKFQREQAKEYRHDVKEDEKFQREQAKEYRHDIKEDEKFHREQAKEYRHDMKEREKWDREYDRNFRPHEHWHHGDRLPEAYRGHEVYVDDWRAHHLYAPPVGHRWVEINGDYILVAIATNVIANILLAH